MSIIRQNWEIRDFGKSPVSLALQGDGPCFAKFYVTEYRKKERDPELMEALRAVVEVPAMVEALRELAENRSEDYLHPDDLGMLLEILARIDGE